MLNARDIARALDLFERFVEAVETIAEAASTEDLEDEAGFRFVPEASRDDN